jgi:hypothetical protein
MSIGDELPSAANFSQQHVDENSNPNVPDPALTHGGGVAKYDRSSAEQNNGGGVASSQLSTDSSGQGTASVQLSDVLASSGGTVHPLQPAVRSVLPVFHFQNPFGGAVAVGTGVQPQAPLSAANLPSNASAAPSGSQLEHDRRAGGGFGSKNFSEMSAEDLVQVIVGKITTFPTVTDCWIQEYLSGAVFLEHVEPSNLGEILNFYLYYLHL